MPDVLPDSRLANPNGAKMVDWPLADGRTVRLECVPVFCANCGAPYGYVPKDNTAWAFWLCQPCFDKYGVIANTMVASDDEFCQNLAFEMNERFGRELTAAELQSLQEQGQLGSAIEKLAKESPYPVFNR